MSVLEKILEEIDTEVQKQRELCKDLKGTPGYKLYEKVASVFTGIVTKHMDEVENDGWIPVSERLPEENGYYLITVKELNYEEHVTISFFDKYDMRGWQHVHMLTEKVTAWKPLPEPYKGGDEK